MKSKLLLSIFIVFLIQSCEDFLDLKDPSQITNVTFWKTAEDAEKGLIAVYSGLKQTFIYNSQGIKNFNCRGDDVIARLQNPNIYNPDLFINTPSNSFAYNMWKNAYIVIYRANQVLVNLPNIKMDDKRKNEIIGETKALRGLAYFILKINFNEVPIILPTEPDKRDMYPSINSSDEVWKQIIEDFSSAKSLLPEKVDGVNLGRMSKFAASAYLGKVYLYTQRWDKAQEELKYIIDNGGYSLVGDVNYNFDNTHENNKESIFEIQYNYFETSYQTTGRAKHFAPPGVGYYVAKPSPWIFEEFKKEKTKDGKLDPRMYATFIWNYPDAKIYKQKFTDFFANNLDYVAWKKYQQWYLDKGDASRGRSDINERVMRLSHVLLMYAEALNEDGKTDLAYEPINKIRIRANLTELASGLTQQQVCEEIRHQRALEFCFEGERWYDIVRWGIGEKVFSENLDRPNYKKGKFDYFPIPQGELDANPNLKQNSNW